MFWYLPFKTKRETTEIPVYNFEVENDSYIVENTIVTVSAVLDGWETQV
jgi:hypothetical protein